MAEGKTKIINPLWGDCPIASALTKEDITAGDGAKHDILPGKAVLATRTTCNVFELLRAKGIPLAYIGRDGPTTLLTRICKMIPVEVVVRRIATGSYLKRHPNVIQGAIFEEPVIEFFYKTSGRMFNDVQLPCDDPLMVINEDKSGCHLYLPNKPVQEGYICPLKLPDDDLHGLIVMLGECSVIATDVNTHLKRAWRALGGTLYDFKLEFGLLPDDSTIVLADVVDCDSWRVMWEGIQLSKQGYREGDDLEKVLGVYRIAASLTDQMV